MEELDLELIKKHDFYLKENNDTVKALCCHLAKNDKYLNPILKDKLSKMGKSFNNILYAVSFIALECQGAEAIDQASELNRTRHESYSKIRLEYDKILLLQNQIETQLEDFHHTKNIKSVQIQLENEKLITITDQQLLEVFETAILNLDVPNPYLTIRTEWGYFKHSPKFNIKPKVASNHKQACLYYYTNSLFDLISLSLDIKTNNSDKYRIIAELYEVSKIFLKLKPIENPLQNFNRVKDYVTKDFKSFYVLGKNQ